jgi:hypothetical protein
MAKKRRPTIWDQLWRYSFVALTIVTAASLMLIANFPSPLVDGRTISLWEYALRASNLLLPTLTILPLATASLIELTGRRKYSILLTAPVLLVAR